MLLVMDTRTEIREFLISRRARVSPERAGLPTFGRRRVPGLRREEVAVLAGISGPYYARLERGDMTKASDSVLQALARALQLDEAERAHLFDLARAANPIAVQQRSERGAPLVRPVVQQLLDACTGAAMFVGNDRQDILGANPLGHALFSVMFAGETRVPNVARFTFLDPDARDFFVDWDEAASGVVAGLRSSSGRNPHDCELAALVADLTRCEPFRWRWSAHEVRAHYSGTKRLRHPLVGEIELDYEQLDLPLDPRLLVFAFTARPVTAAAESLNFLASWTGHESATRSGSHLSSGR
jgi:transcriptional regulator with XRE-family HTH domain